MLFKFFLSLFAVFLTQSSSANQQLSVHGQSLTFSNVNTANGQIISGVLAEESLLTFAMGNELRLAENTRVSFHVDSTAADDLTVYDVFITNRLSKQNWVFSETKSLEINCSKHSTSANYITFRKDKTLSSGCVLSNNEIFDKTDLYILEAEKESRFSLNEDGELLYAQYATGVVKVDNQEVEIATQTGVQLYEDETFRYFTPSENSYITVSTELSEQTVIGQNKSSDFLMPVIFHKNKKVQSGWFLGPSTEFNFQAFGGVQEIVLSDGPLRFSDQGEIETFALSEPLKVNIYRDSILKRTEVNLNLTQTLALSAGSIYELPAGAQINIETGELKNYSHQEQNGLQFIYTDATSSSELLVGLSSQIN